MKDFTLVEPIEYLRIPWRRRWYFLTATVVVIAGVSIYAWLRPNLYRSETRIIVESATLLDDSASGLQTRDRTMERVDAIRGLMESRSILERIVEEFRVQMMARNVPMEDALKILRGNLEIATSKSASNVITMAYYAAAPQTAQSVMRRLAEILMNNLKDAQVNRATDKDQFLTQEVKSAKDNLDKSDENIKKFKHDNLGMLPEQSSENMTALNGLHNEFVAIENTIDRERDAQNSIEFRLQEQQRVSEIARNLPPPEKPASGIQSGKDATAPLSAQLAAKQAQLTDLKGKYKDTHPDVVRLNKEIDSLVQQIQNAPKDTPTSATTELTPLGAPAGAAKSGSQVPTQLELATEAAVEQAKHDLDGLKQSIGRHEKQRDAILKSIDDYQKKLNLAPALDQELINLTREHEGAAQTLSTLEQRLFNSQIAASALSNPNNETYRTQDDASLPERPVPPTQLEIVLMGIGAGLLTGLIAAFGREYFEPSLATEEEAAAVLKVPILVSIPEIPGEPKALLS
jgi:polysaccharide chain length determinant protein (PEP-CTERM system associated)